MSLRIIGGTFKNRAINAPKGDQTRPTLAVMRKALFDILQFQIEGKTFLDIFAGSGAMGIEAMSRGASHATFIDQNRLATRCIQENLDSLQIQGKVIGLDALTALKKLAKANQQFDIIYIDPPYGTDLLAQVLTFLDEHEILTPCGLIFAEEASNEKNLKNLTFNHLQLVNSRTFARSTLHQFRR